MTPLTVTATRLSDNRSIPLEQILELEIQTELDSPATALRLTAATDAFSDELATVTVKKGIQPLFHGRVDWQETDFSAAGRRLQLEARSKGALLLDNEAAPCSLVRARLSTLFGLCIAPYGFVLYHPQGDRRSLPLYTIYKGQSEWEAFCGFARQAYGRTPVVQGDQVVVDHPRSSRTLLIGDGGQPFTRLRHILAPYHILSRIVLRDEDGAYRSAVHNKGAARYGVQRKRYAIPASEFMSAAGRDANQRIRRSMLQKEMVDVTVPGILDLSPGQSAQVASENFTRGGLMVSSVRWCQNSRGQTTRLTLVNASYWE